MAEGRAIYLMYHELQIQGRPLCRAGRSYSCYVVTLRNFQKQLNLLRAKNRRGISVSEALGGASTGKPAIAITFDDGCETDWVGAAPLLADAGFGATFYIVAGFVGQPRYLSPSQLRELAAAGFEIGCHSMTHRYLPGLNPAQLQAEIKEAKERLEQLLGRRVEHFSCPGGRWSRRVAEVARAAGYRSVATSRIGANRQRSDPFCLARVAVLSQTSAPEFERLIQGEKLLRRRMTQMLLDTGKALLGNATYERIRSTLLDHR